MSLPADSTLPPTILTPQQRAARVTAAFYEAKTLHIRDVMRLTQLSRRAAIDLLDNLSSCGGIAITPTGDGKWTLVDAGKPHTQPVTRPLFKIHPNTRAMIAFALARQGEMRTSEIARRAGLNAAEVRWLLQKLRVGGLPIDEARPDVWRVRGER